MLPCATAPDYLVGKFTSLFQGRFKGFSADGIAGLPGNRIHNALRKLAADGSSQSAGQKGSRIHTIAVAGRAASVRAAAKSSASGDVFGGCQPLCGNHKLSHHGTARMSYIVPRLL